MVHFILILSVVLGVVLGGFFGKNEKLAKQLLIISAGFSMAYLLGIAVHNLPISFVLGAFLFSKKWTLPSVLVVLLFALASPAGVVLGKYFNPNWQPYFLALVGGIFIHISSVIIFESNKNHRMDWAKIVLVTLGVALAYLTHLAHSH